jgi:hypothetical protein
MRLHTYYQKQQAALREAGVTRCPPFRVTPGMLAELRAEAMQAITHVNTCQGSHELQLIECPTRATAHNVILAPREDLFVENEDGEAGFQCVSLENDVTAIPDNIACVEVISAGPLVQNVKTGDLVFIDFFDVKQGYILAGEELYLAGCEAFKARYDSARKVIVPLANFVVTRHAPERMTVALTGTDRVRVPPYVTTSGIAGGKTSQGGTSTDVLYQEVVAVGPLLARSFPGLMTPLERKVLDAIVERSFAEREELFARPVETYYHEAVELFDALRVERHRGREPDIAPGDLVVFCRDVAQKMRVRGEFQHLMPYSNVLAVIDDEELLDSAIRKGKAGKLHLVA